MSDEPANAILDPWDRGWGKGPGDENETERAYSAFLLYRDLPAGIRSTRRVVPLYYGPEYTDNHPGFRTKWANLQEWCTVHMWVDRCQAWDRSQADERHALAVSAISGMNDRHAAIANAALVKVAERLRALDAGTIEIKDLVRLLDVAVRIERATRGALDTWSTTGRHEKDPDGKNQGTETMEEADRLRSVVRILVEAGAMPEGTESAVDSYLANPESADPEVD